MGVHHSFVLDKTPPSSAIVYEQKGILLLNHEGKYSIKRPNKQKESCEK